MMATIVLKKGGVYFRVGYMDPALSIPIIETYIYDGKQGDDHSFVSATVGYEYREEPQPEIPHCICFREGEIRSIVDKANLIEWLRKDQTPGTVAMSHDYRTI